MESIVFQPDVRYFFHQYSINTIGINNISIVRKEVKEPKFVLFEPSIKGLVKHTTQSFHS